jgi:hypothetical protein
VPVYDQRGLPFTRIAGDRIDIGAFESQSPSGDFNNDGNVDAADYVLGRKLLAHQSAYDIWSSQFGQSTGGSGLAEVEDDPSTTTALFAAEVMAPTHEPPLERESPKVEAFKHFDTAIVTTRQRTHRPDAASRFADSPVVLTRTDRQLIDLLATRHANQRWQTFDNTDMPSNDPTSDADDESNEALDTAFDSLDFTKL